MVRAVSTGIGFLGDRAIATETLQNEMKTSYKMIRFRSSILILFAVPGHCIPVYFFFITFVTFSSEHTLQDARRHTLNLIISINSPPEIFQAQFHTKYHLTDEPVL